MENTLFPISMEVHIVFALVSLIIFGMQFIRLRKKYYLVLALAIPCSLLAYVIPGSTFFCCLGVAEAAAMLVALILAKTVDRDKSKPQEDAPSESAKAPAKAAETTETETVNAAEETEA